jgi:hypothetical protein
MQMRRALVGVSALQLAVGLAGHVVAVRDRRAFDIALLRWRGRPERVARDAMVYGTGVSAPAWLLAVQLLAVARLAARPSSAAARTLGFLGAAMVGGYLVEREFRQVVRPSGFDPVVTPIAVAGFGLAVPMAVIGLGRSSTPPVSRGLAVPPQP